MKTQDFTLNKETVLLETKLDKMTPLGRFLDLARRCEDFAL